MHIFIILSLRKTIHHFSLVFLVVQLRNPSEQGEEGNYTKCNLELTLSFEGFGSLLCIFPSLVLKSSMSCDTSHSCSIQHGSLVSLMFTQSSRCSKIGHLWNMNNLIWINMTSGLSHSLAYFLNKTCINSILLKQV